MKRIAPHAAITSKENKTVRYLVSLSDPKVRKKERAFLIEGIKMVEEALRDDLGVKQVIAAPSLTQHHGKSVLKLAERRGVETLWVSERLLDALSDSKTPQPVLAVVNMQEHSEETLLAHSSGLIVFAHQLQDPGNLGTIIRTAEAVGASGAAITANSVDLHNPKTIRASMGSVLRVPVVKVTDTGGFLENCRLRGFQTAALALNGKHTLFELDLKRPTVVIVGREGSGLQEDVLESVDCRVRIPMAESIDSLNVAAAAAVILYEAFRQRTASS